MQTDLVIGKNLLNEALSLSGLKSKNDVVNLALKEFINSRKQKEIFALFGKMDSDQDYDYKKDRIR